jgi:hypothetical protein
MKTVRTVFWVISALFVLMLLASGSRSTLSYSAVCPRCMQHAAGVEKSFFGIVYSRKEVHRQTSGGLMSPDIFGPPVAQIDPRFYEEIMGHPCTHVFIRGGFCRYSGGMVACGSFGQARQYEFRHALIENLFRAYRRTSDKVLARETYGLIDELYPIVDPKDRRSPPPLLHPLEAEAWPNEPLSILLRGLALVNTSEEWRDVLAATRQGNGFLDLLQNQAILASRLEHSDPAVRLQAVDQLAAMKDPAAWSLVATVLNDRAIGKHAAERIVWARYLPLFDAVFEADEEADQERDPVEYLPKAFRNITGELSVKEIRALLAQDKPYADRICLAAIRQQNRLEMLDEVVALLNRRPSRAAVVTVESLLEGPYPLDVTKTSNGKSAKDPWSSLVAETRMNAGGNTSSFTSSGEHMYRIQQQVVTLGIQRNPENWPKLRDLYKQWISKGGAEWWAAGFAQAMAESDRKKTQIFLAAELDEGERQQMRTTAALSGLGAIGDPSSLPALEAFEQQAKGGEFDKHPYYRKYLDYALHRCHGIHKRRLVQNADSAYRIVDER